jgi:hypothetical protein
MNYQILEQAPLFPRSPTITVHHLSRVAHIPILALEIYQTSEQLWSWHGSSHLSFAKGSTHLTV